MKKLWYVLPTLPILLLLAILSLFIDPWWAAWAAVGGALAIVGATVGFIGLVAFLADFAERKNGV